MPTSYTSLLGLALPVTGELSGTWGDTVNDYITQYLDGAVAGTQTISGNQTAVTLSKTTAASLSQVGAGATGSSQYSIINCTGNPSGTLTITAPAASKPYIVINATSTNQDVKLVGTGPTTGVTLVAGEKAVVAWNGSDFTKIATSTADGVTSVSGTGTVQGITLSGTVTSTGSLTLGGSLSAVSLTSQVSGTLPVANGGTGVTTSTGTGSVVLSNSPTLTTPNLGTPSAATLTNATGLPLSTGVTGTLPVANGGTGQTTYTDGQLLIGNSSGNTLTKATLTAGSGVSITNGNGSISISATGTGGTVTSVSAGTGMSFSTITSTGSVAIDTTVVPRFASAGTFTATQTFAGSSSALAAVLTDAAEVCTVSATAATGTINYDVTTQSVLFYTSNASANWTVNVRGSSGTSLNTLMSTGQSVTVAFLVTQGSTAYYNSAVQIDGSSVTPKWQGGTAPTAGNASGIDAYVYTIIKTASATFTVLASQTQFK